MMSLDVARRIERAARPTKERTMNQHTWQARPPIIPIGPSIAYIQLTHGNLALIDRKNADWLASVNWHTTQRGYARTSICGKGVSMHRVIINIPDGLVPDHRDRRPLNNMEYNLRAATHSENADNRGLFSNNTSGYRGIRKVGDRWRVVKQNNGKRIDLGTFATLELAAIARAEATGEPIGEGVPISNRPAKISTRTYPRGYKMNLSAEERLRAGIVL